MAFDIATAKEVGAAPESAFDINTAKDAADEQKKLYRPTSERMQKFLGKGKQQGDTPPLPSGDTVGGAVTDLAAKVLPPEGAAAAGYAANVATDAVPMLVGGGVGAMAKAPGMAMSLMHSAIKPVLHQVESGKAARAIKTMLEEGIPASKEGVKMLRDQINALEMEVTQAIAGASGTIDKTDVLQRIKGTLAKFREQATPNADLKTVREAAKEFFNHPMFRGRAGMSVQDAQAIKEGTYRSLGDKAYGAGLKPEALRDTQKAIARGLKEEIEAVVPQVAGPNAKQGELINALKVLSRRMNVDANKNPMGLGWLIHDPNGFRYAAWLADRSPQFKSMLARMLNSGAAGEAAGAGMGAGVGLYGASQEE